MQNKASQTFKPTSDNQITRSEIISPPLQVAAVATKRNAGQTDGTMSNHISSSRRLSIGSSSRSSIPSPILSPESTHSSSLSMRSTEVGSSPFYSDSLHIKSELHDVRLDLICNWLRQKQMQRMWSIGESGEGVMLKKAQDEYTCCPAELPYISGGLYDYVKQLNVKCAMTVNTRTTSLMLKINRHDSVPLNNGLRVQVVDGLSQLPYSQKNQFAAFVRNPSILVVWDDNPAHIIDWVQQLEHQMMDSILNCHTPHEDRGMQISNIADPGSQLACSDQLELLPSSIRKTMLVQPCIVAVTLAITCCALGAGWRSIAVEIKIQKTWLCLMFPCVGPIQAWLGLFFFQTLPTCIAQMIGPVRQMKQNSRFYSGRPPPRLRCANLPHITVQCPVYQESLYSVIMPTIQSIKAAITTYELQGGTANIFINDDGLQLLPHDQAQQRREFYDENNIGWVARPRHNAKLNETDKLFVRAGKFKKASNMNYGLNVSMRVEAKLQSIQRTEEWTGQDEDIAYQKSLGQVVSEDQGATWAAGDIRIGDYILLIDSDTRVPHDCLFDAASEMEQSPEVAILQFSSGVVNVTESWFERGITFFTNLIYTAIEFAVANGDIAPFVGHNAVLRWSAVQDVAQLQSSQPEYHKFWSEDTVSEDFDMALRLQTSGYSIRLATYANGGFKEGVSLTVYDELARWEKYAYGCSELIFNPFAQWIFRGPFTPLFRRFIFSSIPFHSKISIVAYVGTYFAIASSWLLTVLNYFLIGWYNGYLDHYYIDSFKIYFSTIVIFNFIGNVALGVLRYRIDEQRLLSSLFENFKWVIFLTTFLGGISLHVSQAILCHLFSINMSWGATSKEVRNTSFFQEIPVIIRKFRFTFAFCFIMAVMMLVLSGVGPFQNMVPHQWQITRFTAAFPLGVMLASHALLPLALNPGLMQFTF